MNVASEHFTNTTPSRFTLVILITRNRVLITRFDIENERRKNFQRFVHLLSDHFPFRSHSRSQSLTGQNT